jgi:hypothetical protein
MSDRNELARVIHSRICEESLSGCLEYRGRCVKAAESATAAGYRKPRTVTTAEELDALPVGSVLLDPIGISLHKNAFTGWCASNGGKEIPLEMLAVDGLPATVLYIPEPQP